MAIPSDAASVHSSGGKPVVVGLEQGLIVRTLDDARGGYPALRLENSSQEFGAPDTRGLMRSLRRRWRIASLGGVFLAVVAALVIYYLLPPPKVTARVMLFVSAKRPKEIFDTRESLAEYRTYQQTQTTLVTSRLVLETALKQPGIDQLGMIKAQDDRVGWLDKAIKVDFPNGSELLTISLTSDSPGDSAKLVNAVADSYMKRIVDEENNDRLSRHKRLKTLFDSYQQKLREKREESRGLVETVGSNDKTSIALRGQVAAQQLSLVKQELLQLRSDLRKAEVTEKVLATRMGKQGGEALPRSAIDKLVETDPGVMKYRDDLAALTSKRTRLLHQIRNPRDPSVVHVEELILETRGKLEARRVAVRPVMVQRATEMDPTGTTGELEQLRSNIEILREQEKSVLAQVEELDEDLKSFSVKSMDLHWIEDEIALASEAAKTVGSEVEVMNVELQAPPRIRLIEKAEAPPLGDPTRRAKICVATAVGVLFSFVGLVSLLEFYARRIDSPDEVAGSLGMRVVGTLPLLAAPSRGQDGAGERSRRLLVESIDAVRTMLLHASRVESIRTVMVTSATKGEGKTSLACHLATSLARSARTTLLIDCDLRRPSVHRLLDETRGPGLCELLRNEIGLEDAIRPVGSGLSVITAGVADDLAIEALASTRLVEIFARLKRDYDFIIIDTPPLLLVPDALVLSQHVDAALFSILRETSRLPEVHAAHGKLSALGVRILGAVFAGAPTAKRYLDYHYSSHLEPRGSSKLDDADAS